MTTRAAFRESTLPPPPQRKQWVEPIHNTFTQQERGLTTILLSGLTIAHDNLVCAAFRASGYHVEVLPVPDNESLRHGKEFGNKGQCNPTYYTVGNLIKFLKQLENSGCAKKQILNDYLFVTAGACGPCRFGMYVTEYRKALRDAGFEGFRVLLLSQAGGVATASGDGLKLDTKFKLTAFPGLIAADILNVLMYRIRPYEVNEGETDRIIAACREDLSETVANRRSLVRSILRCRSRLSKIKVDRSQVKPKVAVIGEFWATVTEGDGNYHIYRYIEEEGGEVDLQIVTSWLLFLIWEVGWDTQRRMKLDRDDQGSRKGLSGVNPWKRLALLWVTDKAMRIVFRFFSLLMGLKGYKLPNIEKLSQKSAAYYDRHARGGESFMEVGKFIENAEKGKADLTITVKPFGCMPSSGVSDGIQSLVTERFPEAYFLAIETNGEGAVNAYSRIQMQLFKVKQKTQKELEKLLEKANSSKEIYADLCRKNSAVAEPFRNWGKHYASAGLNVAKKLLRV